MKLLYSIVLIAFLYLFEVDGECFEFGGDAYLHFSPNNFNSNDSIHYSLKFHSDADNGIILYAHGGDRGDEEALFFRNGKLFYHLFNQDSGGIGRQFGGLYQIDLEDAFNNDEWIEVDVYRMWTEKDENQSRNRQQSNRQQTGLRVKVNGETKSDIDFLERSGIVIQPTIYIGGFSAPLSSTMGYFSGEIKDIKEWKNDQVFEEPSLNFMSKVGRSCIGSDVSPN